MVTYLSDVLYKYQLAMSKINSQFFSNGQNFTFYVPILNEMYLKLYTRMYTKLMKPTYMPILVEIWKTIHSSKNKKYVVCTKKRKKEEKVILWIHNDKAGLLLDMYVWVNPSFVDVRIRGCASVFHAGHVGNVLRPSIAFRQWLGSEYPQITTAGRNARAARAASSLGSPAQSSPVF